MSKKNQLWKLLSWTNVDNIDAFYLEAWFKSQAKLNPRVSAEYIEGKITKQRLIDAKVLSRRKVAAAFDEVVNRGYMRYDSERNCTYWNTNLKSGISYQKVHLPLLQFMIAQGYDGWDIRLYIYCKAKFVDSYHSPQILNKDVCIAFGDTCKTHNGAMYRQIKKSFKKLEEDGLIRVNYINGPKGNQYRKLIDVAKDMAHRSYIIKREIALKNGGAKLPVNEEMIEKKKEYTAEIYGIVEEKKNLGALAAQWIKSGASTYDSLPPDYKEAYNNLLQSSKLSNESNLLQSSKMSGNSDNLLQNNKLQDIGNLSKILEKM